jgi:hypothetical protein
MAEPSGGSPIVEWLHRIRPRTRILAAARAVRTWLRRAAGVPAATQIAWRRAAWRRALNRAIVRPLALEALAGTPSDADLPVIVCLWRRPYRLSAVLEQLSEQVGGPSLRLILWNNDPANSATYRRTIADHGARGAVASIELQNSRTNLGGIARFVVARHITAAESGRPFVMLDDDEDIATTFITDLLEVYAPRTYAGFWAFNTRESYWDRVAATGGETVNYVGTGGSICDAEIVRDRGFFDGIPDRFGFIEDLWASYYAASRGWRLRKVDTPIELQDEGGNQYHAYVDLKRQFHDYLRERTRGGRAL